MSVNKYVNGKLLQVSGNADTRLTLDDISTILGYTPVNPNIIGTELATLNSSGKLEDSQKPSYSWSEITGKPSEFTPESHTHNYAGSSSSGGAATAALALTTARTLTIGNSGKTFDGSEDVSWTLGEIGAASQSDLDSQGERITTNETSINELNGAVESISNPEYDVSTQTEVEDLVSGEGLPVAIKKLAKAVSDYISHKANKENPHGVTKSQVGLSNVPDVTTNNQTPTYTVSQSLSELSSGETLSSAFGKLSKAIADYISHKADATSHVTSTERATWNAKLGTSDVVNNVSSIDTSKPLSANMGKSLQDQISTLNSNKTEIKVTYINTTTDEYGVCDFSTDKKVISAYLPSYIAIPYVSDDGQKWKFKILSVETMQAAANISTQVWFRYYD